MSDAAFDLACMTRALELARQGEGHVEPNPMVGCLLVKNGQVIGEGWHRRFGGPHAEIEALTSAQSQGADIQGATAYVTLEPCNHQGKTPPCTTALINAGVGRVAAAMRDPFHVVAGHAQHDVNGGGFRQLEQAGIEVDCGLLEDQARSLNAPYLKLIETSRPWVMAKWAMTLDGKIATSSGDSRWISNQASRREVHRLRGRVDAILIGRGTAIADDPLLTARPAGARTPIRIVLDSRAAIPLDSQLAKTADQIPVLLVVGPDAPAQDIDHLQQAGIEVLHIDGQSFDERLRSLLDELGRRRITNLLVEGGSQVLGALLDADAIDEVHAFVAPTLIGGADAVSAFQGKGRSQIADGQRFPYSRVTILEDNVYIRARRNCLVP